MKLQIPYNELEAYIQQKYNQQIALKYVDEKTVSVSKTVKVIVSKTVTANVSVAQLVGNDIFLTYHAGFALRHHLLRRTNLFERQNYFKIISSYLMDVTKKTREYVKFPHICEFSFVILKDNVSRGHIIHVTLCKVIYIYTVSI